MNRKRMGLGVSVGVTAIVLLVIAQNFSVGWERPPIETVQQGYRGTGMEVVYNPRTVAREFAATDVPEPPWPLEEDTGGETAGEIYENVQVLGHLSNDQFTRLMTAITEWVSPEQGCGYCHNEANLADDSVYTKVVSRRMLQMTQAINSEWAEHAAPSGVNCYTCHRGQPVPSNIWFENPDANFASGMLGNRAGQNMPAPAAVSASLPMDPFTPFLWDDTNIRVLSLQPLAGSNRSSIKQTEWTYSLMMHMSDSLGVNCTYCHNTRALGIWDQAPPARNKAWYGIRMVRDLNQNYLEPLNPQYPHSRLGPLGDAPKANCTTCHQGVYKPLYGANMIDDYPSLSAPGAK